MTLSLHAIRRDAEAAKGLPEGDWHYEPRGQTVCNGNKHMVCDIRGWGHLGKLPNGAELQDAMGRHIANLNPDTVLALLDRLEAAEKDAARMQWLVDNEVHAAELLATTSGAFIRDQIDATMKEKK